MDTNTRGHRQWFNFKATSTTKASLKFNLIGLKNKNLYSRGMRPFGRSSLGGEWKQVGENVKFSRKALCSRYKNNEHLFGYGSYQSDRSVYRLSFTYNF